MVFLLVAEMDQLLLTTAALTSDVQSILVHSDVMIGMEKQIDILLPVVNGHRNCQTGLASDGIFSKCLLDQIKKQYLRENASCVPIVYAKFLIDLGLNLCEDAVENRRMVNMTVKTISSGVTKRLGCPKACTRPKGRVNPILIMSPSNNTQSMKLPKSCTVVNTVDLFLL